ncbi:MAG: alanine dehydrogenase [Nitrospinae bacterium]|nr:alanine dehydrogenase [Nitrospinota bacterium]
MIIGLPKEIKDNEFRVGLIPGAVKALVKKGNRVLVESGAGEGTSIHDEDYSAAGAEIVQSPEEVWSAEMVVKVKEPVEEEYKYLRKDLILFTFLHLAANKQLTTNLLEKEVTSIAYESVVTKEGKLPLLIPMSEVAGRMATQVGARCLEKHHGGRGELLGGVPGVPPSNVVILGGGTVGTNAAKIALGMGAQVVVLDVSHDRLQYLDDIFSGRIITRTCIEHNVEESILNADLVIGAVLIPSGLAPWLITKPMLKDMKKGSVIVDVSVDQGGCVETSRPTTHSNPTFIIDDVVHYCVSNMPGAVPRTSTFALVNQTHPYISIIAEHGLEALKNNPELLNGINTLKGQITCAGVASALNEKYSNPSDIL